MNKKLIRCFFISWIAGCCWIINLHAQSDSCLYAPVIAVGNTCNPVSYSIPIAFTPDTYLCTCLPFANNREDGWYKFTATSSSTTIMGTTNKNIALAVYFGICSSLSQVGCADAGGNGVTETLVVPTISGTTYYLRVMRYLSGSASAMTGNICVFNTVSVSTCPGDLGAGMVTVGSLPYFSSGRSTCGKGDNITASNAVVCGNPAYYKGEDETFVFTPSQSGNILIDFNSNASNTSVSLYNGCPFNGQSGSCIAWSQSVSGSQSFCVQVVAGLTYHLVVDQNAVSCISNYSISISAPSPPAPGSVCNNAVLVSSLPFSVQGMSTQCKGNDYSTSTTGSCNSLYESGEDMVFRYDAPASECIRIKLSNTSTVYAGFQVYSGCPGSAGAFCLGYTGGGDVENSVTLPAAGTYFIIVDTWASPSSASFDLEITSAGSGPSNDLPCNATALPLGVTFAGDNGCSTATGEPNIPSCWSAGAMNTVWYSVIAPASGKLKIRTGTASLVRTQIALYEGPCNSLTPVLPLSTSCNQNAPSCGMTTSMNSELNVTGLTPGAGYLVRVDGVNNLTGSFTILALDGSAVAGGLPPVHGQDCALPAPVCNQTIMVGNPGYQSFGNRCDFNGGSGNCLLAGERGTAWYRIPINATGNLEFDIIPNDWPGAPSTSGTDYDFALWNIKNGNVNCSGIAAGSSVPLRCNYDALGVTGVNGSGNSPAAYPGFNASYEPALPVVAGDTLLLVVSNFSMSTSGFTLKFGSSAPVDYGTNPSYVVWTGGLDTDWFKPANWGGCTIPSCSIDAVIAPAAINQPVINASGAVAKSLQIQNGASLKINSGFTLDLCKDFSNDGTLKAAPGSVIRFANGNSLQEIYGNVVGNNALYHLLVDKTGGSVLLHQDADITGNIAINSASSIFDGNNKLIRLSGNFINGGRFIPGNGGVLMFNGINAQSYLSEDTLTHVIMKNNGSSLFLNSEMTINTQGSIILTSGKIKTGTFRVNLLNRQPTSISAGNNTSFISGLLSRKIQPTGDYDFPVGNDMAGYQRLQMRITTPVLMDEISSRFISWTSLPPPPNNTECGIQFSQPVLDNGYWAMDAVGNPNAGTYDVSLFNRNGSFTNPATEFTVMQKSGNTPWGLYSGTCMSSSVTQVQRAALSGLFDFATAQGITPLPAELLSFAGKRITNAIQLNWITGSEKNNSGFEIQRSENGIDFYKIGWVNGRGTTTVSSDYEYNDFNVQRGRIYYYRLRQVDFNGASRLSKIVAVQATQISGYSIEVFPNPVQGNGWLIINAAEDCKALVQMFNAFGELTFSINDLSCHKGTNQVDLQLEKFNLADGIYHIRLLTENQLINRKIVLKK